MPHIFAFFVLCISIILCQSFFLWNQTAHHDQNWVKDDPYLEEIEAKFEWDPLWLIGVVVCLLAANRGSNCSLTRAMGGHIVRYGIISSCQSSATSEILKVLLATSLSHIRSTIASTGLTFIFYFWGVFGERRFTTFTVDGLANQSSWTKKDNRT